MKLQQQVDTVYTSREVRAYVSMIAAASRKNGALQLGVSTRAAISLLRAAQACALIDGRDYVTPGRRAAHGRSGSGAPAGAQPGGADAQHDRFQGAGECAGECTGAGENQMTARFWSLLGVLAALLAVGLSTGGQVYYFLFFALVMVLLLSVASVLWTLFTVRVEMKGLRPRVERGDRLMTIFTVRHTSLLPVSAIRIVLCAPSAIPAHRRSAWRRLRIERRLFDI